MYIGGGNWHLVGETDGDAAPDFFIRVHSDAPHHLSPGDFILL
jgi:hypothetical protein